MGENKMTTQVSLCSMYLFFSEMGNATDLKDSTNATYVFQLHFYFPATCLSAFFICCSAHFVYSSCCLSKLTAAGSTATPAWFNGPAFPLLPVPAEPRLPLKDTNRLSLVKAPVGQFFEQ